MTNWLYRIGRGSAGRRWLVVFGWVLLLATLAITNRAVGGQPVDSLEVPGVESQQAVDLLRQRFPERAGATAMVVFHTQTTTIDSRSTADAVSATVADLQTLPHVISVTDPLTTPGAIAPDRSTAVAALQYDRSTADLGHAALDALVASGTTAERAGVQVEFGGELPTVLKKESTGPAEAIGVVAALVILFVTFRTVASMALPLLTAATGLLTGLSAVGLLSGLIEVPTVAPRLGTMIGLGVGIDYALFVLSRHRDNLASGMPIDESIGRTNATAGKAVVIAGATVVVAILGLQFAGIPFVAALGYSAAIVVTFAVVVAITLLPALLALVGERVLPRSWRASHRPVVEQAAPTGEGPTATRWVRWASWVTHRPWRSAIAATAVLLIAAVPLIDMQLGQADAGTQPADTTQRRAYDLLAAGYGAGFNGPLLLVVDLGRSPDLQVVTLIREAVATDPGIAFVSPPTTNSAQDTVVLTAVPTTEPQARATSELVHRLRGNTLPSAVGDSGAKVLVGGPTASFIDQSDRIAERLPRFISAVVAMSFLLLMIVFRSILVPLKAALLNLLSIGAAYGVVVAVFQWGWGRSLIGLDEAVPIASFVPMMMFAILFGLSMDYEVFILSRIREEHLAGRSNNDSVVTGLGATAKVITAAALIMVSVFVGFVMSPDPIVKMMGIGLATAVAIDATVVRMVLLPATMALVGEPNWWLPRWLDRVLPHLDVEG